MKIWQWLTIPLAFALLGGVAIFPFVTIQVSAERKAVPDDKQGVSVSPLQRTFLPIWQVHELNTRGTRLHMGSMLKIRDGMKEHAVTAILGDALETKHEIPGPQQLTVNGTPIDRTLVWREEGSGQTRQIVLWIKDGVAIGSSFEGLDSSFGELRFGEVVKIDWLAVYLLAAVVSVLCGVIIGNRTPPRGNWRKTVTEACCGFSSIALAMLTGARMFVFGFSWILTALAMIFMFGGVLSLWSSATQEPIRREPSM